MKKSWVFLVYCFLFMIDIGDNFWNIVFMLGVDLIVIDIINMMYSVNILGF